MNGKYNGSRGRLLNDSGATCSITANVLNKCDRPPVILDVYIGRASTGAVFILFRASNLGHLGTHTLFPTVPEVLAIEILDSYTRTLLTNGGANK